MIFSFLQEDGVDNRPVVAGLAGGRAWEDGAGVGPWWRRMPVSEPHRCRHPARDGLQFCEMQPLGKVVPRSAGPPCVVSYDRSESTIVSK